MERGMSREYIETEDGSTTFYVPELKEHYHSVHGAVREALHIFIRAGLEYGNRTPVSVLEAGFGTGLNAWLSLLTAWEHAWEINYYSLEKYPLTPAEISRLNYKTLFPSASPELFDKLHQCEWEKEIKIAPFFTLHKSQRDFRTIGFRENFDIVYYDAFCPDVQPHLWTAETFGKFYEALKPGGFLVTYCVKGIVKHALRQVGFRLERLPGPPGKHQMLRATKPSDR